MPDSDSRSSSPLLLTVAALLACGAAYWLWPRAASVDGDEAANRHDAGKRSSDARADASADGLRPKGLVVARDDVLVANKAALSGTVRTPEGAPIAGAQVCAFPRSNTLLRSELRDPFCSTSRSDGTYRIDGLFPVEHRVSASAPTYIPDRHEHGEGPRKRSAVYLVAGGERSGVDIVLKPGGVEIKGVVRDLSGGVLEGAIVRAGGGVTRSSERGEFSLWVEPGIARVGAQAEGYASNNDRGAAPGHEFEILLTPESVLVGTVVRAGSGEPVAGVSVNANTWGARSNWGSGPAALTDAEGKFRIDGLDPGSFKPTAFDDEHYGVAAAKVHLGLGQTSDPVVIEVHEAFSVKGAVLPDDGELCDAGWVSLSDPKSKRDFSASTERDGSVQLRGVLPGTYNVEVTCGGYVPEERYEPVTIEAATEGLEWVVRGGQSIRGQVLTASGEPAKEMRVSATMKTDAANPRARQTSQWWGEETEDDGSFALYGLKPGTYELKVRGERPGPEKPVEVELPEGRSVDDLEIELPGAGTVSGRVVDERGEPVGDVRINLRSKERGSGSFIVFGGRSSTSTRAADDGTFTIEHVQPGSYRATASQNWSSTRSPCSRAIW